MTDTKTTDPRRADALVRKGSPDPAPAIPFNPERREGVQTANSEPASSWVFNPEHREGVPPTSPDPDQTLIARSADLQVCRVGIRADKSSPGADFDGPSPNPKAPGPKTEAGKSRSSQNAVTHGLRAKKIDNAVAPALRAAYETLRRQYLDEYRPTGAIENTLFDMLVFAAWQLYKIREMDMFTEIDLGLQGSFGRSEKLARYRGSHERLFFRSLNQLKQIQQERLLRETDQKATLPTQIPPGVRLKPLFAHLKTLQRHPKTKTVAGTANRERRERVSSPTLRPQLIQS